LQLTNQAYLELERNEAWYPEHTLERIRRAFIQLSESENLEGWRLDPMGWNYNGKQETDDVDIHLVKGESERASLTILPEPGASRESLQSQIQQRMIAQELLAE
jgi:hypothetical protein